MDLGAPAVLGPESAYRMNHAHVHNPWNRPRSAYPHDGFPSNGGDVPRDAPLYRPSSIGILPPSSSPGGTINGTINGNATGVFPLTAPFSPPLLPYRMSPPSTHHWQQPLTAQPAPLGQPAQPYPVSAFGPIGSATGTSVGSTAALYHQSQGQNNAQQQHHQRQQYQQHYGVNINNNNNNNNNNMSAFSHDNSADDMTDASPSLSDASADDAPSSDSYRPGDAWPGRRAFSPTSLSMPRQENVAAAAAAAVGGGGSGSGPSVPATSTALRRGGGGPRDEFDGLVQFLPRPGSGSGMGPVGGGGGGGVGGGGLSLPECQQQPQAPPPRHHHSAPQPLRALPELPTHLRVQEQDEVLAAVNARLSRCAFDFVARYQFPIPRTPDMRPVQRPEDREWTEWVHLLRRLATRRRIPARVLYQGQIRQLVTVLENSLEMRHAGRAQSSRPPRDDRNVLQLISAGLQVARILQDAPAMEVLDALYVRTDKTIQERTAAEARFHG